MSWCSFVPKIKTPIMELGSRGFIRNQSVRSKPPILLQTSQLESLLASEKKIVPVDATWYLQPKFDSADLNKDGSAYWDAASCQWRKVPPKKDAFAEFKQQHLLNACFFDIDQIADTSVELPHMLPSAKQFETQMTDLGISSDDHVVVYDRLGIFSSPRVYWTFKVFGHENVSILDGGMKKWLHEGKPTFSGASKMAAEKLPYKIGALQTELVLDYDNILAHVSDWDAPNRYQIVDARSKPRWEGTERDPRPNVKPGHMPGSYNLPFSQLINAETGCFKSAPELAAAFEAAGLVRFRERPLAMSCGSGITACILYVAAEICGVSTIAVYDGSWAEYGTKKSSLIRVKSAD